MTLLRLSERSHVLVRTMHHIVSDGWSESVLGRELAALYGRFAAGRAVAAGGAAGAVRGLRGVAARWLTDAAAGAADSPTGRSSCGRAPAALELPLDRPRPAVQSTAGRDRPVRLSRRAAGGADGAVASRGGDAVHDAAGGVRGAAAPLDGPGRRRGRARPSPGATRSEMEGLIGFFVNTLVLRTRPDRRPDRSRELLGRVRRRDAGGLRAPGRAVRAAGRGAVAGARPVAARRCSR